MSEIARAVERVIRANRYAMTYQHPAYHEAETALSALSAVELKEVNRLTGGLNAVIGRGLMVMDDDTVRESGS